MAGQPLDPESQEPDDVGPGTQPVDAMVDSSSQGRPLATQAIFRPDFNNDDDDAALRSADTTPRERVKSATRAPVRRLGGGLVEIPREPDIDPLEQRIGGAGKVGLGHGRSPGQFGLCRISRRNGRAAEARAENDAQPAPV